MIFLNIFYSQISIIYRIVVLTFKKQTAIILGKFLYFKLKVSMTKLTKIIQLIYFTRLFWIFTTHFYWLLFSLLLNTCYSCLIKCWELICFMDISASIQTNTEKQRMISGNCARRSLSWLWRINCIISLQVLVRDF